MKKVSTYVKMQVLGAIEFAEGKSIRERIRAVSQMRFEDEEGHPLSFTWRTISTWFYRYKVMGTTAMEPKPRSDKGVPRKITHDELIEAVEKLRPRFHGKHYYKTQLYRACIEEGFFQPGQIAYNSFTRLLNKYDLLKDDTQTNNKTRLAFSKAHANDMWQADTLFGPHVKNAKTATQTKLIAFIDDASRVLVHGEFLFRENAASLMKTLRSALYKRGIPKQIYVDNGSIYCGKELITVCARLGILLSHTPVRDSSAKGKIERFFRKLRIQFLSRKLDLSSIEALNQQFNEWVENDYNAKTHSAINMKPIDRFGLDLSHIQFLPPHQDNDELFYLEQNRRVKNDNTFSLFNQPFEAPRDLRNRQIQVRFDRDNPVRAIVFYKDQRMGEAFPLNRIGNDRSPLK